MTAAVVGSDQIWSEVNSVDLHPSLTGEDVKLYLHESGESAIVMKRKTNEDGMPEGDRASLLNIVRDERGGVRLEENEVVKRRLESGKGCIQIDFAQSGSTLFRSFLIVPHIEGVDEKHVYLYSSILHSARMRDEEGAGCERDGGGRIEWQESGFQVSNRWINSCCFSSPARIVTTEFADDWIASCIYEKRGEEWTCTGQDDEDSDDEERFDEHQRLASLPLPPCQKEELANGGQLKLRLGESEITLFTRVDEV
eukprot:CAMPEP_0113894088 /NCGR_PEP_ID=MMETSP0780_2-20120614/16489_1 /TAXON_ID=652834 /ORGANISM="Palpitomonas bilix" /LENGTH=253 /DNA_ID=CAMNT_0000884521 /DNA_START=45 /DNA_END=806 /DNA_ORIENTATION=+ /assembly_acc=CAM_ASM_000599